MWKEEEGEVRRVEQKTKIIVHRVLPNKYYIGKIQ